ncbi:antibiotic biosynthesis monooxygenase family protein [Tomitella gaofuii]|uniref:antibiotic biosynthesis monooxygenase family protein n=1 Tax=Tomitella gaofuii TaxID=2760083 RepID=UPI0015FDA821|nr:antibiotic biosynthesis monooxygenase [Tomitella gaofuii]
MIYEHAILDVGDAGAGFEAAFAKAKELIARTEGFRRITMSRCHETPGRYLMLVEWDSVAAHLENFRGSADFERWRALMNPFYTAPPTVEHFTPFDGADASGPVVGTPDA